jgi:hypothetical protein
MPTLTLQDAQHQLAYIVLNQPPGTKFEIVNNGDVIATIETTHTPKKTPKLGTLAGTVISMKDFDLPLEEFASDDLGCFNPDS